MNSFQRAAVTLHTGLFPSPSSTGLPPLPSSASTILYLKDTQDMMPSSAGLSLMDFTAYELPAKKWMKLVRPRIRLRVRVQKREFVSSTVKVGDRKSYETLSGSGVCWPWNDDDERFSRPSFADDELFEVEVERRFLLRYKCIRRTKPVTIDQVRIGDLCALSLYDGRQFGELEEDRIVIGEITFTLQSDEASEDTSSGEISPTYS